MSLPPDEQKQWLEDHQRLQRKFREVIEQQKRLTRAEREAQAARWKAEAKAERERYETECRALLDRQCAPVDVWARLKDAGVQEQHLMGLRQGLEERHALTAARRWWSQPKVQSGMVDAVDEATGELQRVPRLVRKHPFLVLAGGSGLGKSQAAAWCLREAVRAYPWGTAATGSYQGRPFVISAWRRAGGHRAATATIPPGGWMMPSGSGWRPSARCCWCWMISSPSASPSPAPTRIGSPGYWWRGTGAARPRC